jgi:mRNA interferase HigB
MGASTVRILGTALATGFARKHPKARNAMARFLEIAGEAAWTNLIDVKRTFASADYAAGRIIFDVRGNKYRVIASVDFKEQLLVIERVLTHQEYDREEL